jgi:hypothetical protein
MLTGVAAMRPPLHQVEEVALGLERGDFVR